MPEAIRETTAAAPEAFAYAEAAEAPAVPACAGWGAAAAGTVEALVFPPLEGAPEKPAPPPVDLAALELRHAEQLRVEVAAARAQGLEQGRLQERSAQSAAEQAAREAHARQLAALAASFTAERERFLRQLEEEVVRLALAIASRILRREAQADPLLLLGAVRAALGQVAASAELRLRVPPADLDLWAEALALLPHQTVPPTLVAGEGMRRGDCVLETSLGTADLGVRAQLAEIERALFETAGAAAPLSASGPTIATPATATPIAASPAASPAAAAPSAAQEENAR